MGMWKPSAFLSITAFVTPASDRESPIVTPGTDPESLKCSDALPPDTSTSSFVNQRALQNENSSLLR